jgi:hypothetical protein
MQILLRAALAWVAVLGLAFAAAGLAGCTPHVGDHCNQNSDCSLQGTLQCDTSQPNGYCTLFNCSGNNCPSNSACVAFNAAVPGCRYDDYMSPSRTTLPMCMWTCTKDSDCRTSEGYVCQDPTEPPFNAVELDNQTDRRVCVVAVSYLDGGAHLVGDDDAMVCKAAGPAFDASFFTQTPGTGEGGPGDAGAGADGSGAADAASGG